MGLVLALLILPSVFTQLITDWMWFTSQNLADVYTTRLWLGVGVFFGAGLFAVNGPPGTGKTTMLRDLVAALVVERARRLTELADPRDAFTGQLARWKIGDYTRVVHFWKPQFTGFEMVVASANNGAVVASVERELRPLLIGEDARQITRLWELMYNGTRAHFALAPAQRTVIAQVAAAVFGNNSMMFFYMQAATALLPLLPSAEARVVMASML